MGTSRQSGFTLIELAVVVAIVGLLLGGLLLPLATQVDARRIDETQSNLDEIKQALYGFALTNGRLPCPDTDGDGSEDFLEEDSITETPVNINPDNRRCDGLAGAPAPGGTLPWADLGTAQTDAWGNAFVYRVDPAFADDLTYGDGDAGCADASTTGISFELCSAGNITIVDAEASYPGTPNTVAAAVPAVVISPGANAATTTSAHEAENDALDTTFVFRDFTEEAGFEFDDLMIWISPNVLKAKLVSVGQLP